MSEGDSDRGLALATAGDAFISVWKEPSTLARLERVRQVEQALVKHFAPTTQAHAYVIEGSGFRAAALRAVIAGVTAISRPGHPTRVFDRATDAIQWLAPHGQSIDAATLTAALDQARARIA